MRLFGRFKPVHVSVFANTDTGRVRDHNEDRFLVLDMSGGGRQLTGEVGPHLLGPKGLLLAVADGMGGAAGGELASAMVTEVVQEHLAAAWITTRSDDPRVFEAELTNAVELANTRIHEFSQVDPAYRGMGSTLTAVGILMDTLHVGQVGDSRAYVVRKGEAEQITRDQSLTQHMVDTGQLTPEEAHVSERRNVILQALGPSPSVQVELTRTALRRGDALVLCTDGLSGLVEASEIARAVDQVEDAAAVSTDLIEMANARGGPDNITVIVARLDGPGLRPPR